ncbi:MAG: DNA-binding protein [Chlorobiaceae bacterium]|nr:DNA-binding protein [Chlorobiaceae bacterium]
MARIHKLNVKSIYMGRLKRGDDLLEAITKVCRENGISLGRVEAIGAVEKATLGYYDQAGKEYEYFTVDTPCEITSLLGNISLRDGEPMVHAHLTLAGRDGAVFGGHLASGTKVFACEIVLETFDGPEFKRGFDEETGLALWEI